MSLPRWFTSPLVGTAGVLAGLCLLVVPLRKLTTPARPETAPSTNAATTEIPVVLRLKLLVPAKSLRLATGTGTVLLDLTNPAAGESTHDARVPLEAEGLDLDLRADFGVGTPETAVFLTVMPDGYEGKTCYAAGNGVLEETLRYDWRAR